MWNCIGFLFILSSPTTEDMIMVDIGQYQRQTSCEQRGLKWILENKNTEHPPEYTCEYEKDS